MNVLLLLLACGGADAPSPEPVPDAPAQATPASPPAPPSLKELEGYPRELLIVQKRLERADARMQTRPHDPVQLLTLAQALLTRQRLTGDLGDIEHAQKLLDRAVQMDPDLAGIPPLKASLLSKRHHFRDALSIYASLPDSRDTRIARATMRFELGEYVPALDELKAIAAEDRKPDPHLLASIAVREGKLGRFEDADATMARARESYFNKIERWPVAWQHLMLGLMDLDRGDTLAARSHYLDADREVPGWWLVREHLAELDLLDGQHDRAIATYEQVVDETGNPELIGALAEAYEAAGRKEDAEKTRKRAHDAFDALVASHGSLASAHAIEFYNEYGDPARALELAEANAELRPNGESLLLLADAREKNGDVDGAKALREQVAASGWFVPQ